MPRAKKGRCVICGSVGKLTEDHVPPQSVVRPTPVEIRSLLTQFDLNEPAGRPGFRAPTFATLCKGCNSTRLGQEYDPVLAQFSNAVSNWIPGRFEHGLYLGPEARVQTRLNRVLRAVVGHLLAAEPRPQSWDELHSSPMLSVLREYFLSPEAALPPEVSVYCWPYPSRQQVILRGFVRKDDFTRNTNDPILGDVLKFFPVGFWLTWENGDTEVKLPDLARRATGLIDEEIEVVLDLERVPPLNWPEAPGPDAVLLVDATRGSFTSEAKRKKRG